MLDDLTTFARALADLMSDLSEETYCASWLRDLEFLLWETVIGRRDSYGRFPLTGEEILRLEELSEAGDGWIIYDDVARETWIPSEAWEKRFEDWSRTHAASPETASR